MIELADISVSYGTKDVLDGLTASWEDFGTVVLTGASGAGKTTLLRVLAGLQRPTRGAVRGLSSRRIGFVFQEDRLLPWRSVLENVSLVSDIETSRELLKRLDLTDALEIKPEELSGGMRRRVSIARALAFSSDVVLLDEPFTGLDDFHREQAAELIMERTKLRILSTHDEAEAALLSETDRLMLPSLSNPGNEYRR